MQKKIESAGVGTTEAILRSGDTVERVAAILKEQILDGSLAPGQRLISRDLIEELGISRGPLREAFRRLAADRLIELFPNRGAVVRRLSRRSDARRVGTECVSTCSSRWSQYH